MMFNLVLLLALQDPPVPRTPVPSIEEQKKAEAALRQLFPAEYKSKDPAARKAFADQLLQNSVVAKDEAAACYVMLLQARDIAAAEGVIKTAFEAADRMAKLYEVKAAEVTMPAVTALRKSMKAPDSLAELAEAALGAAEASAAAEDFDGALKIAKEAESAAKAAKDGALGQRIAEFAKAVPDIRKAHEEFVKAELSLSVNPDDPAANHACGRYLSLFKGEWDRGLPLLAKGTIPMLKAAAEKDLAKPEDAPGQASTGDAWGSAAEKEKGAFDKRRLQARARFWYERALPTLGGLERARVEKRLEEMGRQGAVAGGPMDLLRLVDLSKDAVSGTWTKEGSGFVSSVSNFAVLQLPYEPPAEYDLTVVVEKRSPLLFYVGLPAGDRRVSVFLDAMSSTQSAMGIFGQGIPGDPSTLVNGQALVDNKAATVLCSMRRGGCVVSVDGKKILEYKGDPRQIPSDPAWPATNARVPAVGSNSPYFVSKITLTPVSGGAGKKLR